MFFFYCSLAHVQSEVKYEQNPFPFNLAREDTRFLGKHPSSGEIDIASFPGSPPYKRRMKSKEEAIQHQRIIDLALVPAILKSF